MVFICVLFYSLTLSIDVAQMYIWGCRGRMLIGYKTAYAVPITIKVVSSNLVHAEVYSIM